GRARPTSSAGRGARPSAPPGGPAARLGCRPARAAPRARSPTGRRAGTSGPTLTTTGDRHLARWQGEHLPPAALGEGDDLGAGHRPGAPLRRRAHRAAHGMKRLVATTVVVAVAFVVWQRDDGDAGVDACSVL